jgi:hypothetical protein
VQPKRQKSCKHLLQLQPEKHIAFDGFPSTVTRIRGTIKSVDFGTKWTKFDEIKIRHNNACGILGN